ncbi:MAG TPA: succinylglutamate desuccinylase/aspartoacylase family protein [Candidatus Woesebacteria bacterium]|nr:succinylglutamate desuccinylase/aspartoacylase family protein [Candidatus Woesebacteria bacterium]HNS94389.1 succinylglutamate desuccinylase/aspartoacylase family protein [Candidatus Woesebacteria bacterium]
MITKQVKLYAGIYGQNVNIPLYEFGTGERTVYVQGGIHGGEVTYFIFHKLARYLSEIESKLKGKVTLAPIVNPVAWGQRMYYYTAGKFDLYKGKDWNRSFPGSDTSLSARMSKTLFSIASQYRVVIDLHTARQSKPYTIHMNEQSTELIRTLGLSYNYHIDTCLPQSAMFIGTLNEACAKKGILEATMECGSHDSYEESAIEPVYASIKRVFDTFGLKKASASVTQIQYGFKTVKTLHSPLSCFAQYVVPPQTHVKKGQTIAMLYPSNSVQDEVPFKAPIDCVVFELPKTHILWEGDELFKIVSLNDLYPIA